MKKQFSRRTHRRAFHGSVFWFRASVFILAICHFVIAAQQQSPYEESQPPEALVGEVDRSGAALHKHIKDYTYTLKKTVRLLSAQAKVEHEEVQEFEAYPVRGEHVLILTAKNGKPLLLWQVAQQRRRAGENLEKAEKEESRRNGDSVSEYEGYIAAAVYGSFRGRMTYISIAPTTFLRYCRFSSPRTERASDRDLIVLNFEARSGVALPLNESYIARLRGRVWIDAKDKILTRLVGWSAAKFTDAAQMPSEAEANIIYEQAKLPTGDWFPTLIRMNGASDPAVFDGLAMDVVFEFSDYKNFKATVEDFKPTDKDQKADKPQKPEDGK